MVGEEWLKEINSDMLPNPYSEISKMIGLDNTLKLVEKYQGTAIYLPKLDITLRKIRDKKIKDEFNGSNHRELAHKYGLTEVWIRQIIAEPEPDQMNIFDLVQES